MNPIHRTALTIATVVATLTVAGALVVDGYSNARNAGAQSAADPQGGTQTIYVRPAPTPGTVTVTQTAPGSQATPPVIHVVVPGPAGGDDGEGGD